MPGSTQRDHVCQYQESDLDFIMRWMEREGIYSFFEHGDAGSKLVICDNASQHGPIRAEAVAYHPVTGADESAGEHFRVFHAALSARPNETAGADYNYLTPDLPLRSAESLTSELTAGVERWAVNEADEGVARRVVALDAERERSERWRFHAVGGPLGVHAGFTFSLDRHPAGELNREYLAVRVVHLGRLLGEDPGGVPFFSEDESARLGRDRVQVEVEAIASDVQFRSPRRTPWPRAGGLEFGTVDGPADSPYAQIDEHGRYLVKLMMDETAPPAGRASMRVRMIQPHGGAQEGSA